MSIALLVLDVQNVYTAPDSELFCEESNVTISNINKLIKQFSASGEPVIVVRHEHKKDGSDIGRLFDFDGEAEDDFNFKHGTDEVKLDTRLDLPSDHVALVKTRYSAFVNTELKSTLQKKRVDTVLVCGFMTNFCCESTARHALDEGFYVIFVPDATGTPGTEKFEQNEIRDIVSDFLSAGFARVLSTDEYIREGDN